MPEYESNGFEDTFKKQAVESNVALGANATYTGPWIALHEDSGGVLVAQARADVTGTLKIQESVDGAAAGAVIASVATAQIGGAGDFIANLVALTRKGFVRVVYVNGAGAQAANAISSYAIA